MSRKRTRYPVALAPVGLVLALTLGMFAPLQAQGPASNPPLAPPPEVKASDCTYATHVHVAWTPVPGAFAYAVKRSLSETGILVEACPLSPGTSCDDTTVPANSPHYYWVQPLSLDPKPLRGPDVGTRRGPGPAAPTGLDASDGAYTDFVRLTWDDHAGTPKYHLRRGESALGPYVRVRSGLTGDRYDDTTAAPGTTYYYQLQAEDHCDQEGPWSPLTKGYRGVGPLPAPTNIEASDCDYEDRVRIRWDDVAFAVKYRVLRAESLGGIKTKLADVTATQYDDPTPELNQVYVYWVRTCTDVACSVLSDYSQAEKGKRCCDPPPVPANVQASDGIFEDKVVVTWDASAGATSYKVYRAATPTGEGLLQDTVTATSWEDTSGDPGTPYYYTVEACSDCGCSGPCLGEAGHRGSAPPVMTYTYLPLVLR
jgi:fibronectin type 3 domain-containing protein